MAKILLKNSGPVTLLLLISLLLAPTGSGLVMLATLLYSLPDQALKA
jgi:hypothetical protein